ncbi:type III-A CRISPR-associated RAMP protein Csm5 [Deinococcus sp. Arct2-2]|uniref:type III-A CRISPR-associated RAMP protein Csm5 n=1 Tax=Deinococcus sp. Arct2-2 TaxID=2568653 RepID=UPI0010A36BE9|nr:type III-A CRISPR-associated RAMP protein Csm5 [Deinococcus sp. Arct2-2]THF70976.1 type III-A CRISPR-associated RAMP protein Csm5 [Deinococcus sp. Arct2-2]
MTRDILKFEIRVKPLSPVHIGAGKDFLERGAYHLYREGQAYRLALLKVRPLAERLLDQGRLITAIQEYRTLGNYPESIAREIEGGKLASRRMGVHPGAWAHLRDTGQNGGLKPTIALANGLPYLPGSSVKGAIRTMWLDWQTQRKGAYARFLSGVQAADRRGRDRADDTLMERKQIAETLQGASGRMQPQNRDLFRAVQVSDLMPDRDQNLTRVQAVLSMSYQPDSHARASNGGRAGAQAWECLNPEAGATYTGTVTIDLALLRRMRSGDVDVQNLVKGLGEASAWIDALAGYGERVYGTEKLHYDMLADLPKQGSTGIKLWNEQQGLVLDWVMADAQEKAAEHLLPLGMGTGLLAHSLLGVLAPEGESDIAFLGDEAGRGQTLMKEVLDTGLKRDLNAYDNPEFPAPKSRRVTGQFGGKLASEMSAERPLGWTTTTLTPV